MSGFTMLMMVATPAQRKNIIEFYAVLTLIILLFMFIMFLSGSVTIETIDSL